MKIDWNSRRVRRTITFALLATAFFVVVPSLFKTHSFNAIVNARYISIHSPIEGQVNSFELQPGDSVHKDQKLATVKNIRLNESFIKELEVNRNGLKERILGFDLRIKELTALKEDLEHRNQLTLHYEKIRVDEQLVAARADLEATRQMLAERVVLKNRLEPLAKERVIKLTDYDTVVYQVREYENRILSLEATVRRIEAEKQAVEKGIYLGQGRNDVPYTQQKLDETRIQLSDVESQKLEQQRRIDEITKQIVDEETRLKLNREVVLSSPLNGIVWKKFFVNSSEVVIGSEVAQVVDCSKLFVDAEVDEKSLKNFNLGQPVEYRLYGSNDWKQGTITGKTGSGNTLEDRTLAAQLATKKDSAKITIRINPSDLASSSADFCHIGRKVEVSIDRSASIPVWISRLTSLF